VTDEMTSICPAREISVQVDLGLRRYRSRLQLKPYSLRQRSRISGSFLTCKYHKYYCMVLLLKCMRRSIRVAWLRQLMSFVRSAQVVQTEIVKAQPAAYRSNPGLEYLDDLIKREAATLASDIKTSSLNSLSLGNHFATLSTSHLLLKLGSCPDQADGVYGTLGLCETMDFLPTSVRHSETLGDYGTALMLQETFLIRIGKHQNRDGMADEVRRYLRIHHVVAKRARDILGFETPVIPPLHYRVLLTKDNWIIEAVASNVSFPEDRDLVGRDLLHIVLDEIPSPRVQPFLNWRVPLGNRDKFSRSALHIACTRGLCLVAGALLKYGAPINIRGPMGWHPLHAAVLDYQTAKLLLDTKDVDPNCMDDFGCTPFWYAARNGQVDIVEAFLDHDKFNPTEKDCFNSTALPLAAKTGQGQIVSFDRNVELSISVLRTIAASRYYSARQKLETQPLSKN
jgi:hypothetical protein